MTDIEVKFYTALIGAGISLIVALMTYLGTRNTQKQVEQLKAELAEKKSENDARRDYQYEARKRLYEECEPLLFQLAEVSEYALYRSQSLARTARRGDLDPPNTWLHGPDYYMATTIYILLAPLAVFKLIQRRITFVDLTVEPQIRAQYQLAKALYFSFTDHFDFAQVQPVIAYDPHVSNWKKLRLTDPVKYWRQGIPAGRLDVAVEALIFQQASVPARLKSYGEFEAEYLTQNSPTQNTFSHVTDVFINFHPATRPVLWRTLIAQAHIYRALLETNRGAPVQPIPISERNKLDWRQTPTEASDEKVLREPFSVAEAYLRPRLGELWTN